MDRRSFLSLLTALPMLQVHADAAGYGGVHELEAASGALRFRHRHNWDSPKVRSLFLDLERHDKFLTSENDFSVVEVTGGNGMGFRSPSPALTNLWISPDARFFVGLSIVMLHNPYQLVVWRADGTVMHREHISARVAQMSAEQRRGFASQYPEAEKVLASRYFMHNGIEYLDFAILGVPNVIGMPAFQFLRTLSTYHPYSKDFSSSVTNWVFWFDESSPDLSIDQVGTRYWLKLRSHSGSRISIPLQDLPPA